MSKKHGKCDYANASGKSVRGREKMHLNLHPSVDSKHKENVVKRLASLFQDTFDLELIQSVAQTCQWDFGKSTEALIVLGGSSQPPKGRSRRVNSLVDASSRHKTKSLPSTLKSNKSQSGRLSDSSTQSMPNGLRPHPAYFSNDSLAAGQVWQRHYKSKPQSPGLLTMIQPSAKEAVKMPKPGTSRSSSQSSLIKESPEVKLTSAVIMRIEQLVQSNVKVMVVMRGVPGSGKTHLAQVVIKMVAANDRGEHIFSADDYFVMLGRGVFAYDPKQILQAHSWNQKRVLEALRRATNPVVVDNTNTQAWEMQPYVTMGVQYGYLIEVLEPVTPWRMREAELARRNVHNVPREKIRQMLDRYEPGWTGEKLLNLFQLKYQHCGEAHVSPELTTFSSSPLTQHRQHGNLEQPEKPKRKKALVVKKDRRQVVGVEINKTQEQQLEELNKLFAEYGKTIDPESRKKVLDAGVPIFEVVSRIRKLQGTLLPMPSIPASITEESPQSATDSPPAIAEPVAPTPTNDYLGLNRRSPTDSIEPDTMSSSNNSETSECDSDSEPEPLRRYLDDCGGQFVDGEDQWEDEEEAKSDGAVSGRPSGKCPSFVTSSQEELSIIDYQLSTPACSSQDELSLLEFQRGSSPNASSSSSEEPKTELSTLQDSLRDVLLRSAAAPLPEVSDQLMRDIVTQTGSAPLKLDDQIAAVDIDDSLIEIFRQRLTATDSQPQPQVVDSENNVVDGKSAKSPDLEEIPLPCVPDLEEPLKGRSRRDGPKLETIIESIQSPPDTELVEEMKKTPLKTRVKILPNFDNNWASISMASTVTEKIEPEEPKRVFIADTFDNCSQTEPNDFGLWRKECFNGSYYLKSCNSRPINGPDTPMPVRNKSTVAMFDKGSMTVEEDDLVLVSREEGMDTLTAMFPDVPRSALIDLSEKCNYDFQWVAEIITDSGSTFHVGESSSAVCEEVVDPKLEIIISDGKKTIKRKKDRKGQQSELSQILKKEMESNFQIGSEHYSPHVLLVKKLRNSDFTLDDEIPPPSPPPPLPPPPPVEELADNFYDFYRDGDKTVPMPMDPGFFQQLLTRFAPSDAPPVELLKDYKPVINIPESLAQSLYWMWVETLNEQVAEMQDEDDDDTKSDALLAAALQELELQQRQPSMQELVDMDLAEKLMLKDKERFNQNRGETSAAVLSRNLLFEKYPHVDKMALLDVFQSEDYSLQRTCDTLKALYGPPRPTKPIPSDIVLPQLQNVDQAKKEKARSIVLVTEKAPKYIGHSDMLVVDPSGLRQEIQALQQRRKEYQQMGQSELSKKNFTVASHYFQEASRLKERIMETQTSSISHLSFPIESAQLPTTLDLHCLFTGEAIQCADLFLDLHISRLSSGRLDLFLITGRGQRSRSGQSRIKPLVQKRLTERQLCYVEDNPGMLRVTIHPNDLLSTAL